jgi:uncharacterized protein YaaN involved in tellurite resistance
MSASGQVQVAAPKADAARVASIRNSLDLKDHSAIGAFGERARREVTAAGERLVAEVRTRDIIDSVEILKHALNLLAGLDPATLIPRGGLADLFNGRDARLDRFRAKFEQNAKIIDGLCGDLKERAERLDRKAGSLNQLHDHAKTFILELDAYLEAGRLRMGEARSAVDPASASKHDLAVLDGAERLGQRLKDLQAVRVAAVEQLPLVRIVQNVDGPLGETLNAALEAIRRWKADWSERLGMHLGRHVRIRPDEIGLQNAKAELVAGLEAAVAALSEARQRRTEAEEQMDRAAKATRRAA